MVVHFVGFKISTLYSLRFVSGLFLPFLSRCIGVPISPTVTLCTLSLATVHGRSHIALSRGCHLSSLKCITRSERTKTVIIHGSRHLREKITFSKHTTSRSHVSLFTHSFQLPFCFLDDRSRPPLILTQFVLSRLHPHLVLDLMTMVHSLNPCSRVPCPCHTLMFSTFDSLAEPPILTRIASRSLPAALPASCSSKHPIPLHSMSSEPERCLLRSRANPSRPS